MTPVERIKERLSILDVVGAYVELHKAGKSYKGKSPFTNEKTPSFFVSPDRGMYYCFSSQKGGDMFTFIQEMEGIDFKGALKILADKAGVELVPEDPKKRDEREVHYALLETATEYFFRMREENPDVTRYITDRGVTAKTIHVWRIGYAPDEWRALKTYLVEKGFTENEIHTAGLIKNADNGKESYDVFRDRVMFPIMDASGRVVAFSGRTLKKEEGVPKYVNSPETELYRKSEILYGYDKAKSSIRQHDFSLIVEGQFDLVLAYQAGYTNTVAVSGTAFTAQHLTLLERLSSRIVLALDSDRAGISAVKRVSSMMLARGMDVKVARMEGGKDPADIIKANPQDFKQCIGKAQHVIEFLIVILKENTKDERTYKLRVREELLPILATMPNRIDREHFEHIIADHIDTTKDAIHYEIERIVEHNERESLSHTKHTSVEPEEVNQDIEKRPISRIEMLMLNIDAIARLCVETRAPIGASVAKELSILQAVARVSDEYQDTDAQNSALFRAERYIEQVNDRQLIEDIEHELTMLSHLIAREQLANIRANIKSAEDIGDHDKVLALLEDAQYAEKLLQKQVHLTLI